MAAPSLPLYMSYNSVYLCFYATVGSPEYHPGTALLEPPCGILVSEWEPGRKCPTTQPQECGPRTVCKSLLSSGQIPPPCRPTAASCTTVLMGWVGLGRGRTQCPLSPSAGPAAAQPLLLALSSSRNISVVALALEIWPLWSSEPQCPWNCHCPLLLLPELCIGFMSLSSEISSCKFSFTFFLNNQSQKYLLGREEGSTGGGTYMHLRIRFFLGNLLTQANRRRTKWPYCFYLLTGSALRRGWN